MTDAAQQAAANAATQPACVEDLFGVFGNRWLYDTFPPREESLQEDVAAIRQERK